MLSAIQRAKILADLGTIATTLGINSLEERQRIENVADFPLMQVTFLLEGKRQRHYRTMLHEYYEPYGHDWTTYYGNISQATISVSIRSLDVDELQTLATAFSLALWEQGTFHWSLENASKLEFNGVDPPHYLPPYRDSTDRHDIYSCVMDLWIDYEFSWKQIDLPITNIIVNTEVGTLELNGNVEDVAPLDELYSVAPGCYLMSGIIGGNNSAYRMGGTIS